MRAILCTAFDGPSACIPGQAPAPELGPGQVRVAVKAASVTYMDMLMTQGRYQLKPPLPYVPGTDAAGRVEALGEGVEGLEVGDPVCCSGWHGAYAELMTTDAHRVAKLPAGVEFGVASMLLHNYLTAHHALVDRAALKPGETLFVTGAAGGVGQAALDMGRMLGARVIAGVGCDAKAEAALAAGADEVVNYAAEDLRARIKTLTEGRGLDVVFDNVGGPLFETLARSMAWGGRIMPIGFASGDIPSLPMNLPLLKGFSVVGVFCGAWNDRFPAESKAASDALLAQVASGALRPVIGARMALEDAPEALALIERREATGRMVLELA